MSHVSLLYSAFSFGFEIITATSEKPLSTAIVYVDLSQINVNGTIQQPLRYVFCLLIYCPLKQNYISCWNLISVETRKTTILESETGTIFTRSIPRTL